MRAHFRCFGLWVVFLALVTAATSCKKLKEPAQEKSVEPWPVLAVLEWGEGPQDLAKLASSFVVYSDRQIVIKRLGQDWRDKPTFWTRILSQEEFEQIDSAANDVLRAGANRASFESGIDWMEGGVSSLYFGIPGKGVVLNLNGIQLLTLAKRSPGDLLLILESKEILPEVRQYCRTLLELSVGDFVPWRPNSITIQFSRGYAAQKDFMRWPDDWPKPDFSKSGTNKKNEWAYIKLDISKLAQIRKLFGETSSNEYLPVEIAGERMQANYRYEYPGEEIWCAYRSPGIVAPTSFVSPLIKPVLARPVLPTDAFQ
jgi:hypothetical protein